MNARIPTFRFCLLTILILAPCPPLPCPAAEEADVELLEQQAFRAAVDRVAPSVVRIETVGGLERVGELLFGSGPTTGLIVDPEGYIISSAFNFIHKPTSILARLADGTLKPAALVATDHNRRLVLLKIDVDQPLPVPEVAAAAEMRVGQWAIAVGRTFEGARPNMSVGIVSALERIWGKAIQTDAAVSPNNYGGPLIDVRGRVLGVLVPLSPQSAETMAGYEWYDSGIGFAVDAEHVMKILPLLKQGEDLHSGVIGIALRGQNLAVGEPVIAACHPNSPAAKAGLKAGDRVLQIDGRKIVRAADIKAELGRRYAGSKLAMIVLRDEKRIEMEVELVAKLEPYQHPFLGVLPMRTAGDAPGVTVRHVYSDAPAADAGIEPGDVLVLLGGKPIEGRDDLLRRIAAFQPSEEVELEIRRGDEIRKVKPMLAGLPEDLPPEELPPARGAAAPGAEQRPQVGSVQLKIPELKNEAWAYVPAGYDPASPPGLVVVLQASGRFEWEDVLTRWKPHCDLYDLILLAPRTVDSASWQPGDADTVGKFIEQVRADYKLDPTRIVLCGREAGATLAYLVAGRKRDLVRAVAAVEGLPRSPLPDVDPLHRLAVYSAAARKSRRTALIEKAVGRMREAKIPVTVKDLGEVARDLNIDELAELIRWIDTLDRI